MSNHWRFERKSVREPAIIAAHGRPRQVPCLVLEISLTGALLELQPECGVLPNEFDLCISRRDTKGCEIVWRRGTRVGIKFTRRVIG